MFGNIHGWLVFPGLLLGLISVNFLPNIYASTPSTTFKICILPKILSPLLCGCNTDCIVNFFQWQLVQFDGVICVSDSMSSDASMNAWEKLSNSNKLHYTQNLRCICSYQNPFYRISSVLPNNAKANDICGVHFKYANEFYIFKNFNCHIRIFYWSIVWSTCWCVYLWML